MSKYSLRDKLDMAYISQSTELTMHSASGYFTNLNMKHGGHLK